MRAQLETPRRHCSAPPPIPRHSSNLLRVALLAAAAVTCLRIIAAARFPLTGDEAYYWEWSRRLDFGYIDHPPLVAWSIALFDEGARSVWRIRMPFVIDGLLTSLCAFDFARRATRSVNAAGIAAVLVLCAPLATLTFDLATPDGPFLLAWAAALACALRALQTDARRWWIALGIALGCAVLARAFGFALLLGIGCAVICSLRRGRIRLRGPVVAGAIAAFAAGLDLLWNAEHHWAQFHFALVGRHVLHGFAPLRGVETLVFALVAGAFCAAPFVLGAAARLPRCREHWSDIALYSAAPLLAVLAVLSLFESVEIYWFAGPVLSLLLAAAVLARKRNALTLSALPSVVLALAAAYIGTLPSSAVARIARDLPGRAASPSALEVYSYAPLARDVRSRYGGHPILTDGYGLSSLLDFYGALPPVVVGYNAQGRQAEHWRHPEPSGSAVYLDPVAIERRPDMLRRLRRACTTVRTLPTLQYREDGVLLHAFSATRCDEFTPHSLAVLDRR